MVSCGIWLIKKYVPLNKTSMFISISILLAFISAISMQRSVNKKKIDNEIVFHFEIRYHRIPRKYLYSCVMSKMFSNVQEKDMFGQDVLNNDVHKLIISIL
jgi:hypothetical protein